MHCAACSVDQRASASGARLGVGGGRRLGADDEATPPRLQPPYPLLVRSNLPTFNSGACHTLAFARSRFCASSLSWALGSGRPAICAATADCDVSMLFSWLRKCCAVCFASESAIPSDCVCRLVQPQKSREPCSRAQQCSREMRTCVFCRSLDLPKQILAFTVRRLTEHPVHFVLVVEVILRRTAQ